MGGGGRMTKNKQKTCPESQESCFMNDVCFILLDQIAQVGMLQINVLHWMIS